MYCVTADTKELIRIDGDLQFPNGIAVLHDSNNKPKTLIVAETPTKTLWQYDILGPGKVGKRSVWGRCPGEKFLLDNFCKKKIKIQSTR